jgi:hypothetical protein
MEKEMAILRCHSLEDRDRERKMFDLFFNLRFLIAWEMIPGTDFETLSVCSINQQFPARHPSHSVLHSHGQCAITPYFSPTRRR